MIRSFACTDTEARFHGGAVPGFRNIEHVTVVVVRPARQSVNIFALVARSDDEDKLQPACQTANAPSS